METKSLRERAKQFDVVRGKLGTKFVRKTGCKRIDRAVARKAMKDAGIVRSCKGGRYKDRAGNLCKGTSYFSENWRKWAYER